MTIIGRGINRVLLRKEGTRGISWCAALPQLLVSPALLARSLRLSSPQYRTTGLKMGQAAGKASAQTVQRVQEQEAAAQKSIDYTRLPKVELHVHMDGAGRAETLRELSRQYGLDYRHDDEEEFKKQIMLLSPGTSLVQFLEVFEVLTNILRTKEAVERVTYEYCEDLKKQNVYYFELRYSPMARKVEPEQYVEGVTAGLERGERDFGVKSRQIIAFIRGKPEDAEKALELALKYRSRGVVGLDIAGNELLPLDDRQRQALLKVRASGLHLTMHAGESGPPANVREAIEVFGAERIGHGYRVLEDETVYQLARERNIHFEACLTSSIFTNSQKELDESHAVKRWALDGTSFSLSTDDPGVMGNDLMAEFRSASQDLGLTKEQLVKSVLDGVAAAFLPDDEKGELLGRVKAGITDWEKSIS